MEAVFSNSDSSKIAFTTSEGSLAGQGRYGGHLIIVDMQSKCLDRVYKEPFMTTGGLSFNTNDSMVCTGNAKGEITVYNLMSNDGCINSRPPLPQDVGNSQITLNHFERDPGSKCEVTTVKFSVVKRYIIASAYQNGQIVIWDASGAFQKNPMEINQSCKRCVFNAHSGKACTSIAFSQVNHLLLTSCGQDHRIQFYDITMGKEVKKIDINQNSSTNQNTYQQVTLSQGEYMTSI